MPLMGKGTGHSAVAPITVQPSGLPCTAELYLTKNGGTTKAATSGVVSFTSTGAAQSIGFSITMPTAWGAYDVYIDIKANGMLIGAYVATEKVTIPDVGVGEPVWD